MNSGDSGDYTFISGEEASMIVLVYSVEVVSASIEPLVITLSFMIELKPPVSIDFIV